MSYRLNRPRQFSVPQSAPSDNGPLLKLIDELTKRINELEQKPSDLSIENRVSDLEQKVSEPSVLPSVVERLEELEQKFNNISLKDLVDVNIDNASDESTLGYDASSDKWIPFADVESKSVE
tara:strand:- start:157 stop:522 length:366 start_codon:yes stop_codon:yes gene_type:complete